MSWIPLLLALWRAVPIESCPLGEACCCQSGCSRFPLSALTLHAVQLSVYWPVIHTINTLHVNTFLHFIIYALVHFTFKDTCLDGPNDQKQIFPAFEIITQPISFELKAFAVIWSINKHFTLNIELFPFLCFGSSYLTSFPSMRFKFSTQCDTVKKCSLIV